MSSGRLHLSELAPGSWGQGPHRGGTPTSTLDSDESWSSYTVATTDDTDTHRDPLLRRGPRTRPRLTTLRFDSWGDHPCRPPELTLPSELDYPGTCLLDRLGVLSLT